jgi:drug/metabolite transporter (DMT)-like permease
VTFLANPTLRLFIGAALISLSPVWVRLVDVSPSTSGFYRVFIGGAALVIYLLVARKRLHLSKRSWWFLVLASAFLALDLWVWHRSIVFIGPGLATLLGNLQVFVMMIAGIVLLRQMPTLSQVLAVPLALLGLALVVGIDWDALPEDYRTGVIFGLLTAVIYASYILALRFSRERAAFPVPTRELAVVSVICAALMALTLLAEGESFAIPTYMDLGWLIGYGVLSHCIGWLFIVSSLSEVSAVEAGLSLLLQPMLSFAWDVLLFDRPMTAIEVVGVGITLAAIYLGMRPSSKQV